MKFSRRLLVSMIVVGLLAFGVKASAQFVERFTIYGDAARDSVLRIVDTPDYGTTYHTLEFGASGTNIIASEKLYIAPGSSKPNAYFQGTANEPGQGLSIDSGTASFSAIEVWSKASTRSGLYAEKLSGSSPTAEFVGDMVVTWSVQATAPSLAVTGSKNALVQTSQGDTYLHAMESPGVFFTDYGTGKLKNGSAWVAIDPLFLETVEPTADYRVFLTPLGEPATLAIRSQDTTGFVVEGDMDVAFRYEIVAVRKGFADKRFGQ